MIKEKLLKLKELIKTHKKLNVVVGSVLIILLLTISIGYFHYGIGMSNQIKYDTIMKTIQTDGYDKAQAKANIYYKGNDGMLKSANTIISFFKENNIKTEDEYNMKLKEATDKINSLKIIKTQIVNPKYYGNYQTIEITVQNNSSKNISYVKIGLDFRDKNGNIIQSDYTNDDNIIKPNSTQKLTKMVSKDIKYDTVQSEVLDFK